MPRGLTALLAAEIVAADPVPAAAPAAAAPAQQQQVDSKSLQTSIDQATEGYALIVLWEQYSDSFNEHHLASMFKRLSTFVLTPIFLYEKEYALIKAMIDRYVKCMSNATFGAQTAFNVPGLLAGIRVAARYGFYDYLQRALTNEKIVALTTETLFYLVQGLTNSRLGSTFFISTLAREGVLKRKDFDDRTKAIFAKALDKHPNYDGKRDAEVHKAVCAIREKAREHHAKQVAASQARVVKQALAGIGVKK